MRCEGVEGCERLRPGPIPSGVREPPAGASGMASVQEVKVQTGGPTEGTRHRGDRGVDPEHRVLSGVSHAARE